MKNNLQNNTPIEEKKLMTGQHPLSKEHIQKVIDNSEFNFSQIKHPNLMEYENLTIDIIHGKFCVIVGESTL